MVTTSKPMIPHGVESTPPKPKSWWENVGSGVGNAWGSVTNTWNGFTQGAGNLFATGNVNGIDYIKTEIKTLTAKEKAKITSPQMKVHRKKNSDIARREGEQANQLGRSMQVKATVFQRLETGAKITRDVAIVTLGVASGGLAVGAAVAGGATVVGGVTLSSSAYTAAVASGTLGLAQKMQDGKKIDGWDLAQLGSNLIPGGGAAQYAGKFGLLLKATDVADGVGNAWSPIESLYNTYKGNAAIKTNHNPVYSAKKVAGTKKVPQFKSKPNQIGTKVLFKANTNQPTRPRVEHYTMLAKRQQIERITISDNTKETRIVAEKNGKFSLLVPAGLNEKWQKFHDRVMTRFEGLIDKGMKAPDALVAARTQVQPPGSALS